MECNLVAFEQLISRNGCGENKLVHIKCVLFFARKQKNYRQHIDQVKYSPVTDTPDILLAKKNARLVSNVR